MFRHSIRNKLILFADRHTRSIHYLHCSLLYIHQGKVTEDTITNNSALISQAKLNILNYLNGVVQASTTIYTGQHLSELGQLYDILERERDIDYMSDKVIKSGLQVMSHAVKEFKQVYLYASVSDRSFMSSNDFTGSTTGKYASLRPFPEDKTVYFETTHLSHSYNIAINVYSAPTPVLSMHRKLLYSPNNTSIGELIIDLHLDLISEISQSLYTHDTEELYILDNEGYIVFGPDPSKWGSGLKTAGEMKPFTAHWIRALMNGAKDLTQASMFLKK